jgi:hypothetical protein
MMSNANKARVVKMRQRKHNQMEDSCGRRLEVMLCPILGMDIFDAAKQAVEVSKTLDRRVILKWTTRDMCITPDDEAQDVVRWWRQGIDE